MLAFEFNLTKWEEVFLRVYGATLTEMGINSYVFTVSRQSTYGLPQA